MIILKKMLLPLMAIVLFMSSCKDKTEDAAPSGYSGYVFAVRGQGTGEETADYLITANTITGGELSIVGNGVEQMGWCYYAKAGSILFSIGYGNNNAIGYTIDVNGKFVKKGEFAFERMDCMGEVDDKTMVAVGAPWGGGSVNCQIQLIDVDGVYIKTKKNTPIYKMWDTDTLNKWPTSVLLRGNKLFITFYPLVGPTWETTYTDTAYVRIFSYPELEPVGILKDTRTSPIGYYGSNKAMFQNESGDIFTVSTSSYAAGFTQRTKPSGILCIRNGKTSFDPDYFFNVETISGGAKLLFAEYVGNGKAVARVVPTETVDYLWGAFSVKQPICKLVVLDIVNKTVTDVAGVPMHGGQYLTPAYIENGKVFMSIHDGTQAYLYEIDPVTATGTKASKIIGQEVQAIYKF